MNDLISRQAAIDALGRIGSLDTYADREYATEIFMNLPSAQQWIPGNERIPEGLIIVQFNDGDFDLLQFPTAYRRKDIVAWMPLPEPWKGELP